MRLVDSHCHLSSLDYQKTHASVADVLAKARERDVAFVLSVATSLPGYRTMREQIGNPPGVAFSCGAHPLNLSEPYDKETLRTLAAEEGVIAIGETGLDYHYSQESQSTQRRCFAEHIRVGIELDKPVIVHTRDARADTLAILRAEQAEKCGGVLHCFTEDRDTAEQLLEIGFYISLSGIITFRNAEQLRDVVRYIPLDRLLIETDSPYLAPVPYRGKENQPAWVREVAEYLAKLKGVSLETLAETTTRNFCQLFHVDLP